MKAQKIFRCGGLWVATGEFQNPAGIVLDPKGYVFVVDSNNDRIQKFTSNGTFVDEWGTAGLAQVNLTDRLVLLWTTLMDMFMLRIPATIESKNLPVMEPSLTNGELDAGPGQFNTVIGIDEDDDKQNVYVTDVGNNRVEDSQMMDYSFQNGELQELGPGQFNNPGRIALDPSGNLFVADFGNNRIQKFDENGNLITMWGTGGAGPGQFYNPTGMTVQFPQGNVFVADSGNSRIQQFDNSGKFVKEYSIGENTGNDKYRFRCRLRWQDISYGLWPRCYKGNLSLNLSR